MEFIVQAIVLGILFAVILTDGYKDRQQRKVYAQKRDECLFKGHKELAAIYDRASRPPRN